MKSKSFQFYYFNLFLLAAALVLMPACNSGESEKNKAEEPELVLDMSELDKELFQDIGEVKKIFYSMPSPLETAMMIRSAGAVYNEDLLNPTDNAINYSNNKSMALNLGIYTCDLSFVSLYDQTEASINYMNASKKMADGLGILDAINDETIERLEENINNRDVIMEIISDTFMNSSSFLHENDRSSVAAIVLVGGWVEGLFLATQMVEPESIKDSDLATKIADQKLSLEIVLRLLTESKESGDVQEVLADMENLKAIFDKIKLTTTSPIKAEVDEETKVTTLKSKTQSTLTPEIFSELQEQIQIIRSKYIS